MNKSHMDNPPRTSTQMQPPIPSIDSSSPETDKIMSIKPKIPSKYKKLFLPLIVTLIMLIGLGTALVLTEQRQQTTTRASLDLVDLTLSGQTNINPGEEVTINIISNPHLYKVSAVDLKIKYPTEKFDFVSLSPSDYLPTILTEAKTIAGEASIVIGSGTTPKTGPGVVVQLKLKAKTDFSGSGLIAISTESQVAGIDGQGNAISSSLLGDVGSITISPTPTATSIPTTTPTQTTSPTASVAPATPTPTPTQLPASSLSWGDCIKIPGSRTLMTYPETCIAPDGRRATQPSNQ